ncbi:MAG: hypothetical protein WCP35_07875 [Verrucomicrobiota bacterium]
MSISLLYRSAGILPAVKSIPSACQSIRPRCPVHRSAGILPAAKFQLSTCDFSRAPLNGPHPSRHPRPCLTTLITLFGGTPANNSSGVQRNTLLSTITSASITKRNPASILDSPARLRSQPAVCKCVASMSCDIPAATLRFRTFAPTIFFKSAICSAFGA